MRDQLNTFQFGDNPVRVVMLNGEPWWIAADVCGVLGYSDVQAATRRLDPEEVFTCSDNSSGQVRRVNIVNESGLYSLVLGSRKPEAKEFKKWITSEVLPSIRKTGSYSLRSDAERLASLSRIETLKITLAIAEERDALRTQTANQAATISMLTPKAEFCDKVSRASAQDALSIREFSKLIGTGQNRFFAWLREQGVLLPAKTEPYQCYVDQGYFRMTEEVFEDRSGRDRTYLKTLITGKGQIWLQRKWATRQEAV